MRLGATKASSGPFKASVFVVAPWGHWPALWISEVILSFLWAFWSDDCIYISLDNCGEYFRPELRSRNLWIFHRQNIFSISGGEIFFIPPQNILKRNILRDWSAKNIAQGKFTLRKLGFHIGTPNSAIIFPK